MAFPGVRVLELDRNYGFGGGSNRGFAAAKNDIVVLLNSDMRVAADFLAPLLEGFSDENVFAVACQIFFTGLGVILLKSVAYQGAHMAAQAAVDESYEWS